MPTNRSSVILDAVIDARRATTGGQQFERATRKIDDSSRRAERSTRNLTAGIGKLAGGLTSSLASFAAATLSIGALTVATKRYFAAVIENENAHLRFQQSFEALTQHGNTLGQSMTSLQGIIDRGRRTSRFAAGDYENLLSTIIQLSSESEQLGRVLSGGNLEGLVQGIFGTSLLSGRDPRQATRSLLNLIASPTSALTSGAQFGLSFSEEDKAFIRANAQSVDAQLLVIREIQENASANAADLLTLQGSSQNLLNAFQSLFDGPTAPASGAMNELADALRDPHVVQAFSDLTLRLSQIVGFIAREGANVVAADRARVGTGGPAGGYAIALLGQFLGTASVGDTGGAIDRQNQAIAANLRSRIPGVPPGAIPTGGGAAAATGAPGGFQASPAGPNLFGFSGRGQVPTLFQPGSGTRSRPLVVEVVPRPGGAPSLYRTGERERQLRQIYEQDQLPFAGGRAAGLSSGLGQSLFDQAVSAGRSQRNLQRFNETLQGTSSIANETARIFRSVNRARQDENITLLEFVEITATVTSSISDIFSGITGILSAFGGFGGGRQHGGPVYGRTPYLVGERGPEIFVPSSSGRVLSNQESRDAVGGVNITINSPIDATGADTAAVARLTARQDQYERTLPQRIAKTFQMMRKTGYRI